MTDRCNWLPMGLVGKSNECGRPCVQEFRLKVGKGKTVLDCHRCTKHTLSESFLAKIQRPIE